MKSSGLALGGALSAYQPLQLLSQEPGQLSLASAGSIRAFLDGPAKAAVAKALHLDISVQAGGADSVAQGIVSGSLHADVFLPITAAPMLSILRAGKADFAYPVASTELVILYSPESRFTAAFSAAAQAKANWWEVLQQPGLRFARSNPTADPSGRAILFAMMLAAIKYHQPDLVQRTLGAPLNPEQIVTGASNISRLQSGELDAMASYRIAAASTNLPYIGLPNDVNLGSDVRTDPPEVKLSIDGKTYYPEPLTFYAAILRDAVNMKAASAFLDWLRTDEAHALFYQYQFAAPATSVALRA